MTDFTQLTNKQLSEAINFHRRQRNLSRGVNESHHMRQTQMVRMLESEEARRLEESVELDEVSDKKLDAYRQKAFADQPAGDDGSDKYRKRKFGRDLAFSKQTGRAKVLATKEEVELSEAETNYVIKHKKTKQVLNTHSDYATAKDEHEGLGADKQEYGIYKQTKKDAALRNRNTYREETKLEEASTKVSIPKSRYETIAKMHNASGPTHGKVTSSPKGTMQYKGARHLDFDKKTDTHIEQTYSHGDHGLATIEKHTHKPTGEVKYFMYKKPVNEEVELDEDTMPSNVASRLSDRHFTAAFHHKKMGNMKGYAAHLKVANRVEDAIIRAGSHMPIRSKQIEASSDKAFKEHPHRVVKTEEVELDEVSTEKLRDYASTALQDKNKAKADKRWKYASKAMDTVANREVKAAHARKYNKTEEVELDEASYRDSGYRNMLKASRKADKEADKMRAQQAKASKSKEVKEEVNLRITKVYNKFPKKPTYAVHNSDRSYHKEFDSMEAAKAHQVEKSK